jgi:hypothetical protein
VATSGDLKSRHKGWFVAKKHAFVMKIFATKTLCPCGVTFLMIEVDILNINFGVIYIIFCNGIYG